MEKIWKKYSQIFLRIFDDFFNIFLGLVEVLSGKREKIRSEESKPPEASL